MRPASTFFIMQLSNSRVYGMQYNIFFGRRNKNIDTGGF